MGERKSILKDWSFEFALDIIVLYKILSEQKREYVLSKQLLRAGTSVGANIREAQNAQSNADFIHKLYISQKECDESIYWLELLFHSEYITEEEFKILNNKANSILKMLRSAILTSKKKNNP
ncbi:four helix bundle protein [Peijinzhouia sedimentorum]